MTQFQAGSSPGQSTETLGLDLTPALPSLPSLSQHLEQEQEPGEWEASAKTIPSASEVVTICIYCRFVG